MHTEMSDRSPVARQKDQSDADRHGSGVWSIRRGRAGTFHVMSERIVQTISIGANILSAAAASVAALLWFWSAVVTIPDPHQFPIVVVRPRSRSNLRSARRGGPQERDKNIQPPYLNGIHWPSGPGHGPAPARRILEAHLASTKTLADAAIFKLGWHARRLQKQA
jgi:hypothetical protein